MSRNKKPSGLKRTERKTNQRAIQRRFLIVCEGKETEPNYFNSFPKPIHGIIEVHGLGKDPKTIVEQTKKIRAKNEQKARNVYTDVWCVFDSDDVAEQTFNDAIRLAEFYGFQVAYSIEAFEIWFLLHFDYHNTAMRRQDYRDKLSDRLGEPYSKNMFGLYNELLEKQPTAVKNAKRLLKSYASKHPLSQNPSTTVHLLVKELNKASQ